MAFVKLLLYIALGFVVLGVAALLITRGQAPESNPAVLFAFVTLFAIPPLGALMMYVSIRYEKNPFPMVLLALLIPFSFLWFYFERVRPGKLARNRES